MTTDLLTQHCDRRAQLVNELLVQKTQECKDVDFSDRARVEAALVFYADTMISESIDLVRLARDVVSKWEEDAAADSISDYFFVGKMIRGLLNNVLDSCHKTQLFITDVRSRVDELSRAEELDAAIEETQAMRNRIDETWPEYDSETYRRSLNDLRDGRHRTAKEILDELRGSCNGSSRGQDCGLAPSDRH